MHRPRRLPANSTIYQAQSFVFCLTAIKGAGGLTFADRIVCMCASPPCSLAVTSCFLCSSATMHDQGHSEPEMGRRAGAAPVALSPRLCCAQRRVKSLAAPHRCLPSATHGSRAAAGSPPLSSPLLLVLSPSLSALSTLSLSANSGRPPSQRSSMPTRSRVRCRWRSALHGRTPVRLMFDAAGSKPPSSHLVSETS